MLARHPSSPLPTLLQPLRAAARQAARLLAAAARTPRGAAGLAAAAALALAASAGSAAAQQVADGVLLVSSSELTDASFAKTVVLVLRHDDNGTIGVVVNRPTTLEPAEIFPELGTDLGSYDGRLYRGGPISPARLLFLVRGLAAATVNGPEIVDKVFLGGDPAALPDITRLAAGTDELRLYAGHAEWAAGQLESEVAAGGWRVVPGTADLVFAAEPGKLWDELSKRRGDEVVAAVSAP